MNFCHSIVIGRFQFSFSFPFRVLCMSMVRYILERVLLPGNAVALALKSTLSKNDAEPPPEAEGTRLRF